MSDYAAIEDRIRTLWQQLLIAQASSLVRSLIHLLRANAKASAYVCRSRVGRSMHPSQRWTRHGRRARFAVWLYQRKLWKVRGVYLCIHTLRVYSVMVDCNRLVSSLTDAE